MLKILAVSCRAVIGAVAEVRLQDVRLISVAYAVAAAGRRLLADGYHTLQVCTGHLVAGRNAAVAH